MSIVSETELLAAVTRDRAAGKRVGFLRLGFDVLRVEVVRVVQASAAKSERLAVAVIDQGGQPVISVSDRAELVDGLRGVDYVIVCANDDEHRLAGRLAPYIS